MRLVVFLPSAQALTFEDVEILVDDVNLFIFTYRSKSDDSFRKAKFYIKNIVGYATAESLQAQADPMPIGQPLMRGGLRDLAMRSKTVDLSGQGG